MNEYAFDVKLFAALRVKADTEAEARALLDKYLDCATVSFGEWPEGSPNAGEASIDGEPELFEVNGEFV